MHKAQLIAVDMDGTFLNNEMDYDRRQFADLYPKMRAQGIQFVVASGNQYYQLRSFFAGYPDIIFLSENGGLVRDAQRTYFQSTYTPDVARKVAQVLTALPAVEWLAAGVNGAYVLRSSSDAFITDARDYYHRLQLIDRFDEIDDDIVKFSSHCPAHETAAYVARYHEQLAGFAVPTSSGHGDIDIIQPGIHKARGLAELGAQLDIPLQNMVTFGNGGNDIEMLQEAGLGVAMRNSPQDVLDVADAVTTDNNHSGVLTYIADHILTANT
ncbi:Cof-type HAD-IIB family hydrolase [Lacticaseibacillus songhuajiangensis]|jgi:Cof subfamily protein (haloacid dehalogenase superfamily)|uniref:Cof-type HAD-IIB family hydrolase n=1 Tax=Lacticaseibacillus songhuajiangensis TaxID=1296539 RepID=UPI001CDD67CE|nr:Cof-type HAD-IIB family hydrolase [Lacticaseibacillus songhuajiangensis]